jgi:peptidoglycan/LPS O-acetylase OafA/YrhL
MVPGWFGAKAADGVYWTLRYEIAFYAVVTLLLPWIKRGHALRFGAIFVLALPWLPEGLHLGAFFVMGIAIHEWRSHRLFAGVVLAAAIVVGGYVDLGISAPLLVLIAMKVPMPRVAATWAGVVSYPLYLLHDHIGCVMVMLCRGVGLWPALVLSVISVVLLAAFVTFYLERPVIAFFKRTQSHTGFQQSRIDEAQSGQSVGRRPLAA